MWHVSGCICILSFKKQQTFDVPSFMFSSSFPQEPFHGTMISTLWDGCLPRFLYKGRLRPLGFVCVTHPSAVIHVILFVRLFCQLQHERRSHELQKSTLNMSYRKAYFRLLRHSVPFIWSIWLLFQCLTVKSPFCKL